MKIHPRRISLSFFPWDPFVFENYDITPGKFTIIKKTPIQEQNTEFMIINSVIKQAANIGT